MSDFVPSDPSLSRRRALLSLASVVAAAAVPRGQAQVRAATDIHRELQQLSPTVYAFLQREAAGQSNLSVSNCGFVVGPRSMLCIDSTGAPVHARRLLAAARGLGKPIDRVVLTHDHPDHIVGLPQFPTGIDIVAQENTRSQMLKMVGSPTPAYWSGNPAWADPGDSYQIVVPNVTYRDRMSVYYGDTEVQFRFPGRAHTSGDTLIYIPRDQILFAGDIAFFGVTPLNGSGYVSDWMKVCDQILSDPDVTTIVPGHGPVGGKKELADMRGYLQLLYTEGRKRYDAGLSAGRAAADINLEHYAAWTDADRIVNNMARLYSEFKGTIAIDTDRAAITQAKADYKAARAN